MCMKKKIQAVFYLFFPLLVGGIVGFIISKSIDYKILIKPPLAPPAYIFPVAWTIIYLLMGISYYLLCKKVDYKPIEKIIYYLQLFVNAMWSIIFFVFKLRFFAIIWILLLLILIITMMDLFKQTSKISYYLNFPYLIWTIFATYLTIGIYVLN